MEDDRTYKLLVNKMHEVAAIPPQEVGGFTNAYKKIVPFFKYYPWKSTAILSFLTVFFLYLTLGAILVRIASMLQYGL